MPCFAVVCLSTSSLVFSKLSPQILHWWYSSPPATNSPSLPYLNTSSCLLEEATLGCACFGAFVFWPWSSTHFFPLLYGMVGAAGPIVLCWVALPSLSSMKATTLLSSWNETLVVSSIVRSIVEADGSMVVFVISAGVIFGVDEAKGFPDENFGLCIGILDTLWIFTFIFFTAGLGLMGLAGISSIIMTSSSSSSS